MPAEQKTLPVSLFAALHDELLPVRDMRLDIKLVDATDAGFGSHQSSIAVEEAKRGRGSPDRHP
jgi:hypothetical protein